jgi:hypothetical protein
MVDRTAPERIWLTADEDCRPFVTKGPLASPPRTEYIRADLYHDLEAELSGYADALAEQLEAHKAAESERDRWSRLYDKVVAQDAEQYKHLVTAKEKLREMLQKEN